MERHRYLRFTPTIVFRVFIFWHLFNTQLLEKFFIYSELYQSKIKIQNIARNMKTAKCSIRCVLFDSGYFSATRKMRKASPEIKINPTPHSRTKKWFTLPTPRNNFCKNHNLQGIKIFVRGDTFKHVLGWGQRLDLNHKDRRENTSYISQYISQGQYQNKKT